MFSAAKDKMTSHAAKSYLNDVIKTYGEVEELTIDSKQKRVSLTCRLLGETDPITVAIDQYQVEKQDGRSYLIVTQSKATKPWLQAALQVHLHERRIALPAWAVAALG